MSRFAPPTRLPGVLPGDATIAEQIRIGSFPSRGQRSQSRDGIRGRSDLLVPSFGKNKRKPVAGSPASRICPKCKKPTAVGLVTNLLVIHDGKIGERCAGSGTPCDTLPVPKEKKLIPAPSAKDIRRKKEEAAAVARAKQERLETLKIIRDAVARERAQRDVGYHDEYGGERSVRARSGGLPEQGKRR